jgi:hypothetical protein
LAQAGRVGARPEAVAIIGAAAGSSAWYSMVRMTPLQRYLITHVNWRVASVAVLAVMAVGFWSISRWLAYAFIVLGALELVTLPYYWKRAQRYRHLLSA